MEGFASGLVVLDDDEDISSGDVAVDGLNKFEFRNLFSNGDDDDEDTFDKSGPDDDGE